jgi:hypothetical protein
MASDHAGRDYKETGSGYECTVCVSCKHKEHAGPCSHEAPPPELGIWVRCTCKKYAKCGKTFESLLKANFHSCG